MAGRKREHGPPRPEFFQEAPEYHGVLVAAGRWRLAVSPNGKRYLLQELASDGGAFIVRRWRKQLSKLRPDVPECLASGARLDTLPEWPGDLARPWADAMASAGRRVRRALASSDDYAGVIALAGDARLAIAPNGQKYLLQERDAGRWRNVFASPRRSSVFGLVFSRLQAEHKAAAFSRVPALMSAVAELPPRASAYSGRRVERLADALEATRRPPPPE